MAKHVNPFAYASDEKEVYAALQRDFKRDDLIIQMPNIVVIVGLLYLCRHLSGREYLAALAVGGGVLVHICYFVT